MAYDNPTKFHQVWLRHLREMCWTNLTEERKKKKNN
jgi:hypothetical protein